MVLNVDVDDISMADNAYNNNNTLQWGREKGTDIFFVVVYQRNSHFRDTLTNNVTLIIVIRNERKSSCI